MGVNLLFPTTADITHLVRHRVQDPATFVGINLLPTVGVEVDQIEVDVLDFPTGMTLAHQLGSDPKLIKGIGQRRKVYTTGYWKETRRWDEAELLKARKAGTFNVRAGRDLINTGAIQLDNRLEVRQEWLRWQALDGGVINIDENGVKYSVDFGIPTSHVIDLTDGGAGHVAWSDHANSTPISDIIGWTELFIGTGARPDTMYYSLKTANDLILNAQVRDLLKQSALVVNLSTQNLPQVLSMFIPQLKFQQYDQGYASDDGHFHFFVPDSDVIITGVGAPGEKLGDFCSTISLHNGGIDTPKPGKFAIFEDKSQNEKNPFVDLTVGIYGLPRLFHPNWLVKVIVADRTNEYDITGNL